MTDTVQSATVGTSAGTSGAVDDLDLTPVVRRRRWRQAAQLGMYVYFCWGLVFIAFAVTVAHKGGMSPLWSFVDALVIVLGLTTMVASVVLTVRANRGKAGAVRVERTLGIVLTVFWTLLGIVVVALRSVTGLILLAYAAFFAGVMVPGAISTARSLRVIAAGGRDGLLGSLTLGQARARDLLGRRPELSRVPPWHLYVAVAATMALPLTLELIVGIPHSVAAIVGANLGGIAFGIAVSIAIRQYLSRRMLDVATVLHADPRAPVLYLRSFSSDHRRVWILPRLYPDFAGQGYRVSKPYDEFVGEALAQGGPVIAIGEPGRQSKTLGVATEQIDDTVWQREALSLMQAAGVIVILAGRTGGLRWEIEHIAAGGHLAKTVILLPKSASPESQTEWETFRQALEQHGVTGLRDAVDVRRAVAVLPETSGPPTVISVKRKSAAAYALAIRAALLLRTKPEAALADVAVDARRSRRGRRGLAVAGAIAFALVTVVAPLFGIAEAADHSALNRPTTVYYYTPTYQTYPSSPYYDPSSPYYDPSSP